MSIGKMNYFARHPQTGSVSRKKIISRLMDGFDVIYRTVRDKFSCENEYSGEEDGLHVIFEQLIIRTREYAERLEREALEVWGGFHTILEGTEKTGETTSEAGV